MWDKCLLKKGYVIFLFVYVYKRVNGYWCVLNSLGLSGGDTATSLGSMKGKKEEVEDEEVFLPVGLLMA